MKTQPVHNLHVPIPHDLYQELRSEAERSHLPTTKLVREAVKEWLRLKKSSALENSIREYAAYYAGSSADLDRHFESASIDSLLNEDESK